MEKKRPQLNLAELQQLRWVLGGLVALVAAWAVFFLDIEATGLLVACSLLVPLAVWRPKWVAKVPAWMHRLAFPGVVVFFVVDWYLGREVLATTVRLALVLLVYRAISYRKRRDDLQLVLLALFLIVVAGVLTVSMVFAVQIVVFAILALGLMMAVTVADEVVTVTERGVPVWASEMMWPRFVAKLWAVWDWRLVGIAAVMFAGVVGLSAGLFMVIPRFQLEDGLFLDRLMPKRTSTGFSDTLKFGDVTDIQGDDGVAMSVDVAERGSLPKQLYWRMVVLDEYREQGFRVSDTLRARAFAKEVTRSRIEMDRGARGGVTATFYIEPVMGRYLPLTGGFARMAQTEARALRVSDELKLVMLREEPSSMRAYQVENMAVGEVVVDEAFARLRRVGGGAGAGEVKAVGWMMLEVTLAEADRAKVAEAVQTITGGRTMTAKEFTAAAMGWLGRKHAYSLRMKLEAGPGDALVRWMVSSEPGHCELFAGAFTLLARVAGYPTRVVVGYVGGEWNEDHLTVKNANAHAWCEVFDPALRGWQRVDPTAAAGLGEERSAAGAQGAIGEAQAGWSARMDRLRLFWYRRVVSFDQRDQVEAITDLKGQADRLGRWLKTLVAEAKQMWKRLQERSWDRAQIAQAVGVVVVSVAVGVAVWRVVGWLRRRRRPRGARALDPVRSEAAYWLRLLNSREPASLTLEQEWPSVRAELRRVRFGPLVGEEEATRVFRRARSVAQGAKKRVNNK